MSTPGIHPASSERRSQATKARLRSACSGTFNHSTSRAYAEAQLILAEQRQFRLPDKKWREFCEALDAPPKDVPALRKLLTERGVFDA